mmetsp:Transcript_37853/g.119429  ORF Transcript_37853/g.119429 Transcript_37853/m.119429 type:complete len:216 (-) Transcript_37853:398-1045(-)
MQPHQAPQGAAPPLRGAAHPPGAAPPARGGRPGGAPRGGVHLRRHRGVRQRGRRRLQVPRGVPAHGAGVLPRQELRRAPGVGVRHRRVRAVRGGVVRAGDGAGSRAAAAGDRRARRAQQGERHADGERHLRPGEDLRVPAGLDRRGRRAPRLAIVPTADRGHRGGQGGPRAAVPPYRGGRPAPAGRAAGAPPLRGAGVRGGAGPGGGPRHGGGKP